MVGCLLLTASLWFSSSRSSRQRPPNGVNSEMAHGFTEQSLRFHQGAQNSCTIRNVPVAETCGAPTSRKGLKLDRNRPNIDRPLTFVQMGDVAALRSTGSSHPNTPTSLVKSLANGER